MPKGDAKEGYLNTNAHLEAQVVILRQQLAESQAEMEDMRALIRDAYDTLNCCEEGDIYERSHRCGKCDENVDRDGEIRRRLAMKIALPSYSTALREMIAAEREACATECESIDPVADDWSDAEDRAESRMAKNCAAAIRGRNGDGK